MDANTGMSINLVKYFFWGGGGGYTDIINILFIPFLTYLHVHNQGHLTYLPPKGICLFT